MDDPDDAVSATTLSVPTRVSTRWVVGKGRAWKINCCKISCQVDFCLALQVTSL